MKRVTVITGQMSPELYDYALRIGFERLVRLHAPTTPWGTYCVSPAPPWYGVKFSDSNYLEEE